MQNSADNLNAELPLPRRTGFWLIDFVIDYVDFWLNANKYLETGINEINLPLVQKAIARGANVNKPVAFQTTYLHLAAWDDCPDIVRALIDAGANREAKNFSGLTPLFIAASRGRTATVRALVDAGANVHAKDRDHETALFVAARHGHADTLSALIALGADVNPSGLSGINPLHKAAQFNPSAIRPLVALGANVNARSHFGSTPLFWAAIHNKVEAIRTLVDLNADVDARDNHGETPLFYAAKLSAINAVRVLIELGANVNATNNDGNTPIVLAFEDGHYEVVELLQRHGAVLPEHLRENEGALNRNQSTHTVTVHVSVSKSVKKLQEYFQGQNLEQARDAFFAWGNKLPQNTREQKAAKKAIQRLRTMEFTDLRSGITLSEALGLVWLGMNDILEIKPQRPLNERLEVLINHLYQMQRGYNLNAQGIDNNKRKNRIICVSGHFNKLIESLNSLHSQVEIHFVTGVSIGLKAQALVDTAFQALDPQDKNTIAATWTHGPGMPEAFVNRIRDNILQGLHEAFDEFQSEVPHYDTIITETVANLAYLAPTRSVIAHQNAQIAAAALQPATALIAPAFNAQQNQNPQNQNTRSALQSTLSLRRQYH